MTKRKANKGSLRQILSKIWFILWEDDSWYSWIISAIVAFLLIKFIVYPVLGLGLGTSHPIVAVVSGSMEHPFGFDEFWEDDAFCETKVCTQGEFYNSIGITKDEFIQFPYKNGFNKGDIMILYGKSQIDVGDVIVFMSAGGQPIIHRVIKKQGNGEPLFQTKGDNNEASINTMFLSEFNIPESSIIGEAKLKVPYLGYVKIWFVELLSLLHIM